MTKNSKNISDLKNYSNTSYSITKKAFDIFEKYKDIEQLSSMNELINVSIQKMYSTLVSIFDLRETDILKSSLVKTVYISKENRKRIDNLKVIFGNNSSAIRNSIFSYIILHELLKKLKYNKNHNVNFEKELHDLGEYIQKC